MDDSRLLKDSIAPSSAVLQELYDMLGRGEYSAVVTRAAAVGATDATTVSINDDDDAEVSEPSPRLVAAEVQLLGGVALGRTGRHDDALRVGKAISARYPDLPYGSYLVGMSLMACQSEAEGQQALHEAFRLDGLHRQAPMRTRVAAKLASTVRRSDVQQQLSYIRKHCTAVHAVPPAGCESCGFTTSCVPPRWLCPRCYCSSPSRESPMWQPDKIGVCRVCEAVVGSVGSRHHCRSCGGLVCAGCSDQRIKVSVLGFSNPVRVCSRCAKIAVELASKAPRASSPQS